VERGAAAEDVDERLRLEVPDPRAGRVPRPLHGEVRVLREELAVEDVARDGPEQVRRGQRLLHEERGTVGTVPGAAPQLRGLGDRLGALRRGLAVRRRATAEEGAGLGDPEGLTHVDDGHVGVPSQTWAISTTTSAGAPPLASRQ